jgi:hypothetical protein
MENTDTLGILKKLERGEISASEADAKLTTPQVEPIDSTPFDRTEMPAWVHTVWSIPLIVGTLIVMFGAWMIAATAHTNLLWFLLGIPLVLFGSLFIVIGASAFSGHWLYVNVEESRRHRHAIRFGMPFPIGLLRLALWIAPWAIKRSRNRIRINHGKFDLSDDWADPVTLLAAFERELKEGRGITIDVDDQNERVQVYIV